MSDRNKFEEMLELLVNEDRAAAESLFHELVVEKSRKIYENLLEDELDEEEVDEATDEEVDEATDEEVDEATDEEVDESSEEVEEGFDLDEFEVEADPMDMGGDPADDMMGDIEADDDEAEMGDEDEGDMEDRVVDLEDALDELKAEFEKMMDGDDEGDDEGDMDMDMDMDDDEAEEESFAFETTDEEVDEATDEEVDESEEETDESAKSAGETMREYVEKVSATMGDNGDNTKSTVAGANNMGGTTANIAKGGESNTGGTAGGLANPATSEESAGNVNVPGGKASKSMKAQPKGHGAEKKGSGDNGANTKSTIGS